MDRNNNISISKDKERKFRKFANDPDCFKKMRDNYIPEMFGNELVKEAMMLQHIGSSFNNMRNNIHILLLGTNRIAKSQIVFKHIGYSPSFSYTDGINCNVEELTANIGNDLFSGEFRIKLGLLPKAYGRIVGCDELDNLNLNINGNDNLVESLKLQKFVINTRFMSVSLDAKFSFIASGSLKGNKFNPKETLAKQTYLSSNLLGAFDLIFVLKAIEINSESIQPQNISKDFIEKYLHYSKTHFKPTLSQKAKDMVSKYYVIIDDDNSMTHHIKLTMKQIQSMIRFASAYAKFHHKNIIDEQCIEYAYNLFNQVLSSLGSASVTDIINTDNEFNGGEKVRHNNSKEDFK